MDKYSSIKIRLLSFILIIMIVYIHGSNLSITFNDILSAKNNLKINTINLFIQIFFSDGIARSAVPLFFLISGYLFFTGINNYNSFDRFYFYKLNHRSLTLLLPYIFWSIFGIILLLIFQNIPIIKNYITDDNMLPILKDLSYNELFIRIFFRPIPYQLWFMRDLIALNLLSPLIYYQIRYYPSFSYIIIILLLLIWLIGVPLHLLYYTPLFFYVGSIISLKNIGKLKPKKPLIFIFLFIWFAVLTLYTLLIIQYKYDITWLQKIAVLIGIIVVWYSYDIIFIQNNKLIYELSSFTFIIFVSHEPVLTLCKTFLINLLKKINYYNSYCLLIIYIFLPIFIIYVNILLGSFLKRYFQKIFVIITGNR